MIIEVNDVSIDYMVKYSLFHKNKKEAIKKLNFSVAKGELVGYLGVNGAGKSTTIKLLTGILVPTSGSIKVLNKDPFKNRKKMQKK